MVDVNDNKNEYIEESFEAESKIKQLRKILKRCKLERQEYLEGWQRSRADHQNYIKQKNSEIEEFRKFIAADIFLKMIPILDNLIFAYESIPEDIRDHSWAKGVLQIRKHFESAFHDSGVEEIATSRGEKFDPSSQESVQEVEGGGESGTIAEVLQRGYTLNGKVIRAARVKVIK